MGLFQRPPSEPGLRVSSHPALQCLFRIGLQMGGMTSVGRLSLVGDDARRLRNAICEQTCVVYMSALWPNIEPGADDEPE